MNTTEAHTIALHSLIRDMRHALRWIAGGLTMLGGFMLLNAGLDALEGDRWFSVTFGLLAAVWWFGCAWTTYRRSRKYYEGADQ